MDKFDAMQIFVRVLEKGSFSAVAKERGIGQPAVSKQISSLEDELGTELIHRTSRSIAMTDAGRDFLSLLCTFSVTLETASRIVGQTRQRAHSCDRPSHFCPPSYGVKAACVFCCLSRDGS